MTTVIPQGYILFTPTLEHEQYEPLLIGMLLSFAFFGIGLTQFYAAWTQIRALWALGDRDWFHIIMLGILLVADFADTATKGAFFDIFTFKIITGGAGAVALAPPIIISLLITAAFIASMTHLIYCRRIIRLQSRMRAASSMWLVYLGAILIMALSIVTFAAACITGYIAMTFESSEWIPKMVPSACVELAGSAVVDVALCIAFIWSLRSNMSDFQSTNDIVTRWTMFTLETNLLTSVLQILELILFLLYKDTSYHEAIILVLPKIYINSILLLTGTVFRNRLKYKEENGTSSRSESKNKFSNALALGRGGVASQTASGVGMGMGTGTQGRGGAGTIIGGITVNIEKQYAISDDIEMPEVKKENYDHTQYDSV